MENPAGELGKSNGMLIAGLQRVLAHSGLAHKKLLHLSRTGTSAVEERIFDPCNAKSNIPISKPATI